MTKFEFSRQLIKGRVAEVVFAQMFRDVGGFTIIPFGYENTFPELAQYQDQLQNKDALDNIRSAPDFVLISHDKRDIYLVEVKYRAHLPKKDIYERAEKQLKRWDPSYIFLASLDGFYFDHCRSIVSNSGSISPLEAERVPLKIQESYLSLLREFELGK